VAGIGETLLHAAVAFPVPLLLFVAGRRMRTPARRGLMFGTAGILFPVLFFASYGVFCVTCQ
jgi:CHASE2 domain-containing sensor protein